jgi:hypothetical protein
MRYPRLNNNGYATRKADTFVGIPANQTEERLRAGPADEANNFIFADPVPGMT